MDIYGCTEPAERGLRCYVHRIASGLGLGPDLVPAPEDVVRFAKDVLTGHYPSHAQPPCLAPTSGDALSAYLADYRSGA